MIKRFKRIDLLIILLAGLGLRVELARSGTYWRDFNTFVAWGQRLQDVELSRFYEAWSDYLPGYLYVLWLLGKMQSIFGLSLSSELLYKLPAIIADLLTGVVIYFQVSRWRGQAVARVSTVVYLFNPAVLANSTLWGQVDAINTLFYLLAVLAGLANNLWLAVVSTGLAVVIKPQGLVILPLVLWPYWRRRQWSRLVVIPVLAGLISLLTFLPFVPPGENVVFFAWERFQLSLNQYQFTSLNAFNFWTMIKLGWRPDYQPDGVIKLQVLGLIMLIAAFLSISTVFRKKLISQFPADQAVILTASLVFLALFLFPTRVHERHLFSALPFLALTGSFLPIGGLIYSFFSFSYCLNMIHAYIWLTEDFRSWLTQSSISLISFANLAAWLALVLRPTWRFLDRQKVNLPVPTIRYRESLIVIIFIFGLVTRLFRLNQPGKFYFDEVYHAFTAAEMVKGHSQAWEWWNTPPEGVAYEWTHPPLAKEMMAAGILVFGEKAWAWRLPGALLGAFNILLIYAIGKLILPATALGLTAAFLYAVDFLPLVQSRIGMNDIYFLFFQLLSFWIWLLGLKEINGKKRFSLLGLGLSISLASISWGLALASKWSAIYGLVPIGWLIASWLWSIWLSTLNRRVLCVFGLLIGLLVAGWLLIVYLVAYLPFFSSGHSWSQFSELQKQMWWYHTNLKATHPYTSPWWSWPLDLKSVWYYVGYQTNEVANIYALGNPVVWWLGLLAMAWWVYWVIKLVLTRKNCDWCTYPGRELIFIVIGYLSFWLPWSISPRIMFIYHYLPSLPFLYLGTAWSLLWWGQRTRRNQKLAAFLLGLTFVIFIAFYPHLTAINLPSRLERLYYWLPGWR